MCLCDSTDDVAQTATRSPHFYHDCPYLYGAMFPFLKIRGACMHHMLPFIFRPLRNTHLKCLLVSFLHFVLVFMNKVPFDTGTEREVVPMLELSGGVYCFRQNMLWISRLFGWTVTTPQCCGGWH